MAEEFNWLTIIIPIVASAFISLGLLWKKKVDSTGEGTLTGTIRLQYVDTTVKELGHKIDRLGEKFDEMRAEVSLNKYRIQELERKTGYKNGNGGSNKI